MTIRRKLLLFIPLLVLLANSVTFFLFQSSAVVQQSYDVMMSRILLYQQAAQTAEDQLKPLYGFLLNPSADEAAVRERAQAQTKLEELRSRLVEQQGQSPLASELTGYLHMLDTLMEQSQSAFTAARNQAAGDALLRYEEAERTTGFIREEGQRLVTLELKSYEPVFKQIQAEHTRLNRLGAAVFVVDTLMGVALAYWISRSITRPVSRLVDTARRIAKGDLQVVPPALGSKDELAILSDAFRHMLTDLLALIEKDKQSLEKDRLVKELELQALQSQINPHFLFNTLNVLSKLALIEGAERTSDLIISMSNLLRYNLRKLDQPVTLGDELKHVQEYFTIQQARFRDRVRFEVHADEQALKVPVPALTIQPLIENAFLHGIEGMEEGARIRLDIRRTSGEVTVSVADNGQGMTEETRMALLRLEPAAEAQARQSTGLGTRNVFKRLQLFYERPGLESLVAIDSQPGRGTTVTIRLPDGKEEEAADVPIINRG
ncbi:sensor histidine kinase [Paenibacillus rigui]|uniref:histidine kinase n=1 Tax=Paenibacillus rigui TaxID=554312 RepID=A0A229UZA8_9BACL|nr:sensor histidine kinase [Paenibacillus rigui]OXM88299.1 two-component sensor histidine kinase [Paenibacillus rigui]